MKVTRTKKGKVILVIEMDDDDIRKAREVYGAFIFNGSTDALAKEHSDFYNGIIEVI